MSLIDIQPLVDIIGLTVQSIFVKNEENGVNLLLIAQPETAKTSTLFKFATLDYIAYYDEITAKKLIEEFLEEVKKGRKRTLIIPDLINCIEKQRSTRQQFLKVLKSGIDDTGIKDISTPYKWFESDQGLKFNLVTAITRSAFDKPHAYKPLKTQMRESGLLSRFIPFSYTYEPSKIDRLFEQIKGKLIGNPITISNIVTKDRDIGNNPEEFSRFEKFSVELARNIEGFGFRPQRHFQRLAKAHALMRDGKSVEKEDVDKILQLMNWINFRYNPL